MHMTLVARAFERIGDNAVDIGEQVAFVVTGLFREFSDSSRPARTRRAATPSFARCIPQRPTFCVATCEQPVTAA